MASLSICEKPLFLNNRYHWTFMRALFSFSYFRRVELGGRGGKAAGGARSTILQLRPTRNSLRTEGQQKLEEYSNESLDSTKNHQGNLEKEKGNCLFGNYLLNRIDRIELYHQRMTGSLLAPGARLILFIQLPGCWQVYRLDWIFTVFCLYRNLATKLTNSASWNYSQHYFQYLGPKKRDFKINFVRRLRYWHPNQLGFTRGWNQRGSRRAWKFTFTESHFIILPASMSSMTLRIHILL